MKWLTINWYRYLFGESYRHGRPTWKVIRCRIKGHPRGTVYYNPGGWEPDNHCKDCGEDLE